MAIDQSQPTARENDDNRAIQSEEEEKERERERVTFFEVGIYFRPISGIPRRKYPPRAGCITRRGMRRAEREKRKEKVRDARRRGGGVKEGGICGRKGGEFERRDVGTRHPST